MSKLMSVSSWIEQLDAALSKNDAAAAAALFQSGGFWRDMLAFTWTMNTFEGARAIEAMLSDRVTEVKPANWTAESDDPDEIEGFIRFETALGRGRGYVRLEDGRCTTLLTALDELKGFEEQCGRRRPEGYAANAQKGNWLDRLNREFEELGHKTDPYVLIVGGGQGGLSLAARLRQLNVPTIVVDRNARPGDQWRSRYNSLSLHDPVWYDHLPYLPFPENWPVFTPKDKMAQWLDCYADLMEINIWQSTECTNAAFDEQRGRWRVTLRRDGASMEVFPSHLVLATGNAGKPTRPVFPGMESFEGVQCHSSEHPGGAGLDGKRVVVVGSNNSAHDICADLVDYGADVTMLQRSATTVVRQDTFMDLMVTGLYSEDAVERGITTDRADLIVASVPLRMLPQANQPTVEAIKHRDADFYRRLEEAGFLLDFGEDDTGILGKYLRRASGYYIDVGASALVADGVIKVISGVGIDQITSDGLMLSDGRKVLADVIIYATGFGSMDEWADNLLAGSGASPVGKVWGYGSETRGDPGPWEGEMRNMWKPTSLPGLWFHGGNLAQARFYSKFLALQLKARFEQIGVSVYSPRHL
jgi:putative flavoprotein involved in K+ transport